MHIIVYSMFTEQDALTISVLKLMVENITE